MLNYSRRENTLPILVLLLGFLLRVIVLNQSFWLDEATSGYVARDLGYLDILTKFSPGDFHPPLYYLILKAWGGVFGFGEVPLRMFSVVASLVGIYLVYGIAKKISSEKVTVISTLFAATSPLWIYYSQEARMYALEITLVLALVYIFVLLEEKQSLKKWLAFSLTYTLLVFTDYLPVLMIFVFAIFALSAKKDRRWWRSFCLSFIIPVILLLFWMPTFRQQLTSGFEVKEVVSGWWTLLGSVSLKNLGLIPVKFILGRISFDNKILYAGVAGVTGLVFAYILLQATRGAKKLLQFTWLWFLVPLILGVVVSFKISVLSYFRFIFVLPAMYLLLAYGVVQVKKKLLNIILIVFVLTTNLLCSFYYLLTPRFHREDWRGLVSFLKQQAPSQIVLPANSQTEGFRYYDLEGKLAVVGPDGVNRKYAIIWLMRYVREVFDPNDLVRTEVESLGYTKVGEHNFNGVEVWKYVK